MHSTEEKREEGRRKRREERTKKGSPLASSDCPKGVDRESVVIGAPTHCIAVQSVQVKDLVLITSLHDMIKESLEDKLLENDTEIYMFDEMNITQSLFNWQANISISTNKEGDLFSIINRPMIPAPT